MSGSRARIGLLGGTFDPIHMGHLALAAGARLALGLERVLFVPTGQPWLKAGLPISDARHRVEMVRLGIAGEPAYSLSTIEVERSGPTYTVDTLEQLAAESHSVEYWLILGMDALEHFHRWKQPERILELCLLAVAGRLGHQGLTLDRFFERFPSAADRVESLPLDLPDISATGIRHRAANGESLQGLVPDAVAGYIHSAGLYRDAVEVDAHSGRQSQSAAG